MSEAELGFFVLTHPTFVSATTHPEAASLIQPPHVSPMSSFLSQRTAQNSPSITMEKGTYRIRRGPLLRNPENFTFPSNSNKRSRRLEGVSTPAPTARTESQAISARLISQEKRLVLLVMFLMFATFCCFGTAYYLFTTSRWASVSSRMGVAPRLVVDQPRITPHQDDTLNNLPIPNTQFFKPSLTTSFSSSQSDLTQMYQPNPRVRPDEKFLSYLPHSGFHNQRIALENALVLARLLNRTLLVPPIRFGRRAIPYRNFTVLQRALDANYMAYLCQLSENAADRNSTTAVQTTFLDLPALPERCVPKKKRKPVTYTYLPWGWVTNFDFIRKLQPTIQTFGSTHFWLSSRLDLHTDDILVIPDTSKYQYRFTDEIILDPLSVFTNATYSENITLSSLTNHPAKLIQLGSLFGSRRLRLSDPTHKAIRKQVRRHMSLEHPLLRKSSVDIATKISGSGSGSGFLGAHLRCHDGYFLETAMEHSRMLWWKLVHGILGLSVERTRQLELDWFVARNSSWSLPFEQFITPSNFPIYLPLDSRTLGLDADSARNCKGRLHTDPDLERLNVPLFIATDSKDPHTDEHLGLFRQTFPCILFLGDFPQEVDPVTSIRDPVSGTEIGSMLVPFLDAMVVARATRVVGTPHSTFSWYVQDVLWRINHGFEIKERGSS